MKNLKEYLNESFINESAFMESDEVINQLAKYIHDLFVNKSDLLSKITKTYIKWYDGADEQTIANDLYNCNRRAISYRYGKAEAAKSTFKYSEPKEKVSEVQILKWLESWQYQCSERKNPGKPYGFIYELIGKLYIKLSYTDNGYQNIRRTKEYEDAAWE
jgi:hypothetical protein